MIELIKDNSAQAAHCGVERRMKKISGVRILICGLFKDSSPGLLGDSRGDRKLYLQVLQTAVP